MPAPETPLRRSLFFVPGSEPRKLEKARAAEADTLLLDLEDSVALPDKARARDLVVAALRAGGFAAGEVAVRVNPPGTPWFDEDLEASISAGAAAVLLPKCERPDEVAAVAERMRQIEERSGARHDGPVRLLALVESAAGILGVAGLGRVPRVEALCFGHADFSRDMGLSTADAAVGVVLHARCTLAIAARAASVDAIDTVYLDVRDTAGFRRDVELGRSLGFAGKLCIHPAQVPVANEVHTPSHEEIAFARRVLEAAASARAEGRGVFTVDGKMVDAPLVAAQERVLERARRAGVVPAEGSA